MPGVSPSSGAFRATFPQRGKAFALQPTRQRSLTGRLLYGFPLWGKLSPQVTDEGVPAGSFPLIRRARAPPSPKGGRLSRRGGVTRCSHTGNAAYRVNLPKGFPLWGKLSPQVTDEGVPAGSFPLIRRARAPPSPKGGRLSRRGGVTRCSHTGNAAYRVNLPKGFPLWGKLSPQVTDEGVPAGRFPLIRRARAPPSPKGGRLSRRGGITPPAVLWQ